MKYIITALIILGLYSTGATADCLDKKNVNFMPVGIATELCFTSEVLKLKLGSARNFIYEIEVDDNIPPSYKEKGIKAVVTLRPAKSGIVSNIIVDTKDGRREEYFVVSTTADIANN